MLHAEWIEPWFWLGGSLLMVGFWVLVVVVIVGLVRRGSQGGGPARRETSALQVLEERYARGEVSREEFLERRAVLLGEARPAG